MPGISTIGRESFDSLHTRINIREYRRDNQNEESRETVNIGYRRRRQAKQKYNTIYVGQHMHL
jgi:hypothetical protein